MSAGRWRPFLQIVAAAIVLGLFANTAWLLGQAWSDAAPHLPAPGTDAQSRALARYALLRESLQGIAAADYLQDASVDPGSAPDAARVIHAQLALAPTILWYERENAVVVLDLADPTLLDRAIERHGLRSAEPAGAGVFLCRR